MASINIKQLYKVSCRLCGMTKKSHVPGNFVCSECKKYCKQQLSGEELNIRQEELYHMIANGKHFNINTWTTENTFIAKIFSKVCNEEIVSNEQYLSVCRILKKGIK